MESDEKLTKVSVVFPGQRKLNMYIISPLLNSQAEE